MIYMGNRTEEKGFEKKKVFKEDLKELTGRVTDRNRQLVPDSWCLVRECALTRKCPVACCARQSGTD